MGFRGVDEVLLEKIFTIKELNEIALAVKVMELMMNLPVHQPQVIPRLALQLGEKGNVAKLCNLMMITQILLLPLMERLPLTPHTMETREEIMGIEAKVVKVWAKEYPENKIPPLVKGELLHLHLQER